MEAVEADLIGAYVQGELSQSESRRFEDCLLSPERRSNFEFARGLT
jgi:hypothetical protein